MQHSCTAVSELQCVSALLIYRCIYFVCTAGDERVNSLHCLDNNPHWFMTPDLEHEFVFKEMAHSGLPCCMACLLQWWIWLWTVASLWPVHQQTHPVVLLPCQQHKERHSLQVYNCQLSQGIQLKRFHSTVCQLDGPQKCAWLQFSLL